MKPSAHYFSRQTLLSLLSLLSLMLAAGFFGMPASLSADSNETRAYKEYVEGHRLNSAGKFREAIHHLDKAIADDPTLADAYVSRGFSYGKLGTNLPDMLERSIVDYTKAISLIPKDPEPYNNRGFTLLELNQIDNAIADFNFALELKPDAAYLFANRGEAYLRKGELYKAINDTTHSIELYPDDADSYATRGDALLLNKNYRRAIEDYDSAIKLNPKPAESFHNIDAIKAKRTQAEKALRATQPCRTNSSD